MRRTILIPTLAAAALLFAADTASAQYRVPVQSYSFNPWVRYPNYQVTTVAPFCV